MSANQDENIIKQLIDIVMSKLNDETIYSELHNTHIYIDHLKINYIKHLMNKLILNKNNQGNSHNEMSNTNGIQHYVKYILNMLLKSFPIIKTYTNDIISIFNIVDKYNIHPNILHPLLINILYSIYIFETKKNINLINNQEIIQQIQNIIMEVGMCLSIFDEVINNADIIFNNIENIIGYNSISLMSQKDFNVKMNEFMENIEEEKSTLRSNYLKLNMFITYIDHTTENSMRDTMKLLDNKINNFDDEKHLFDEMLNQFKIINMANYYHTKKYNKFSNIDIDIMKLNERNILYYWIDYISDINMSIIKNFTNNKK